MKRFVLCLLAGSISLFAQTSRWEIDPVHSNAAFSVRHMMISNVRGEFHKVTGTVVYDPADPSKDSIDATIDATTIDTREGKRNDHLKSPDFLDVAKFPAITFKSKKIWRVANGLKALGDLTIHGVTKEVTLDIDGPSAEIRDARGGEKSGASASTKINRKDFGLNWNRALEAGGVLVGDEVSVTIDVEMSKKI